MSIIDLNCKEAISFTNNGCFINEKKFLLLDNDYLIYLLFDFVPYSCLKHLKQARLILFKLPDKCMKYQIDNKYIIYPLTEFFSIYSCLYVDYSRGYTFEGSRYCSFIEMDITDIVEAWLKEEIENKGLLLKGHNSFQYNIFASEKYEVKGMRPMLRIIYEENQSYKSLSIAPCTVKVN